MKIFDMLKEVDAALDEEFAAETKTHIKAKKRQILSAKKIVRNLELELETLLAEIGDEIKR